MIESWWSTACATNAKSPLGSVAAASGGHVDDAKASVRAQLELLLGQEWRQQYQLALEHVLHAKAYA